MSDTNKDLIQRADLALSNLTSDGGLLNPEQQNRFIRNLIDQPTLIRAARSVTMSSPEMKLNKIGFGSRILRAARQSGGANDAGGNNRYVREEDRAKPDLGQVTLTNSEVIAEVHLPYEVLEDNIERGDMTNTILTLIAERAALDLEELFLKGDTASGDDFLALQDGVIKRVTSNVVDGTDLGISSTLFNETIKSLPTRYRRNKGSMRMYVPMDIEQDYRLAVSQRGTDLGDAMLTGNAPLPVLGVPMKSVALMPDTNGFFVNPKNFIFGIQRNVRIETDKDIRARQYIIVLTARVGITIEEELAAVKLANIGATSGS